PWPGPSRQAIPRPATQASRLSVGLSGTSSQDVPVKSRWTARPRIGKPPKTRVASNCTSGRAARILARGAVGALQSSSRGEFAMQPRKSCPDCGEEVEVTHVDRRQFIAATAGAAAITVLPKSVFSADTPAKPKTENLVEKL